MFAFAKRCNNNVVDLVCNFVVKLLDFMVCRSFISSTAFCIRVFVFVDHTKSMQEIWFVQIFPFIF